MAAEDTKRAALPPYAIVSSAIWNSRKVRRAGAYFEFQIDNLNRDQLTDYFAEILDKLSWSTLKTDLYGLKFYYAYVLDKP